MRVVNLIMAAALAALPGIASAEPVTGYLLGMTFAQFMVVAQVVAITVSIYQGAQAKRQAKRDAKKRQEAAERSLTDRLATVMSTEWPDRYIYGTAKVGVNIVNLVRSGANDRFQYLVGLIASHEITAVDEIWVAGQKLGNRDATGWVTDGAYFHHMGEESNHVQTTAASVTLPHTPIAGSVAVSGYVREEGTVYYPCTVSGNVVTFSNPSGRRVTIRYRYAIYESRVMARVHLGTYNDPVDYVLHAAHPSEWPATSVLRGYAYIVLCLDLAQPEWQGSPPTVELVVRGKKIKDVRTGAVGFNNNAANVIYDYLTSPFGGVPAADIPIDSYIAAANVCAEYSSYIGGARYTIDGVVTADEQPEQVLNAMEAACAGSISQTTLELRPGKWYAPVAALSQSDQLGGMQISPSASDDDTFNTVRGRYVGAATSWISQDFAPFVNQAYKGADEGELAIDMSFPYTTTQARINNLCRMMMEDQRNGLTVKAVFSLKAMGRAIGDRVTYTHPIYGFNNKTFRITDKQYPPTGGVELTLKEDAASIWDESNATVEDSTPNSNLPNPYEIASMPAIACESGEDVMQMLGDGSLVSRIKVSWQAFPDGVVPEIQLQYRDVTATDWARMTVDGAAGSALIAPVIDGMAYEVRARTYNRAFEVFSPWAYAADHTVIGKTQPPSNVQSATLSAANNQLLAKWPANRDWDLDGYEVRTADTGWGSVGMAPLWKGNATEFSFLPAAYGVGDVVTVYVRAFDRTGNYSEQSAAASYTIEAPENASGVSATFADTSQTNATVTLDWIDAQPVFGLESYEVSYDGAAKTVKANTITLPADWVGDRAFTIKTIDRLGNKSVGLVQTVAKFAPNPVTFVKADVIDNSVMLKWGLPEKTTLPVHQTKIKQGDTWESAEEIGVKPGTFTVVSELAGGTYKYWLAVTDTDGVESDPTPLTVRVGEPPNYVFVGSQAWTKAGAYTRALLDSGTVLLPVNTTETTEEHFASRGWATPQDKIDAGYPLYLQPTPADGSYVETFDFGNTVPSSKVTVAYGGAVLAGSPVVSVKLELSNDNATWTDYGDTNEAFGTNFRFVRFTVRVDQLSDKALYQLESLTVTLASKEKDEAGSVDCVATDASGTIYNFQKEFVDVDGLQVTAKGTAAISPIVDHNDNVLDGSYSVAAGVLTVNIPAGHGLIAGQRVKVNATSGLFASKVVTVDAVSSDTVFTASVADSDTSGNCTLYHQSARIYLYTSNTGARVSGVAFVQVKGK